MLRPPGEVRYHRRRALFFAHCATFVSPGSFTPVESILVLSLLVFGGMGSVEGSIAGAVILTGAPEGFRFLAEGHRRVPAGGR